MTSTALEVFTYGDGRKLGVYGTADEPLFLVAEVCKFTHPDESTATAVKHARDRWLDPDERTVVKAPQIGVGNPNRLACTEPGLYKIIARGTTEQCKKFDRWVRHEVLPSIRKTGGYGDATPTRDTAAELAAVVRESVAANRELVETNRQLVDTVRQLTVTVGKGESPAADWWSSVSGAPVERPAPEGLETIGYIYQDPSVPVLTDGMQFFARLSGGTRQMLRCKNRSYEMYYVPGMSRAMTYRPAVNDI